MGISYGSSRQLPDQFIREPRWFAFEQSRDEILQQLRIKVLFGFSLYRLRKNVRASASMLWPLRVARAQSRVHRLGQVRIFKTPYSQW